MWAARGLDFAQEDRYDGDDLVWQDSYTSSVTVDRDEETQRFNAWLVGDDLAFAQEDDPVWSLDDHLDDLYQQGDYDFDGANDIVKASKGIRIGDRNTWV